LKCQKAKFYLFLHAKSILNSSWYFDSWGCRRAKICPNVPNKIIPKRSSFSGLLEYFQICQDVFQILPDNFKASEEGLCDS